MKIIIPKHIPFKIYGKIIKNFFLMNTNKHGKVAVELQNSLLDYLTDECVDIIEKYKNVRIDFNSKRIARIIWVLWWQGNYKDNPIVLECIRRMQQIKGFDVRVITKKNVSNYIEVNDFISLYDKGRIYIQHLADIIRIRLLKQYGGIWLDASIAVIDSVYFDWIINNYCFFSNKFYNFNNYQSVSWGKWSTYFWATFKDNPLFSFVDEMMTSFILRHQGVIDYTQFDYSLMVGYRNISFIKRMIDLIPENNQNMWWLGSHLLEDFNSESWNDIIKDTHLFKISAKRYAKPDFSFPSGSYWDYIVNYLWRI